MDEHFYTAATAWGIWASVVVAMAILHIQNRTTKELTGLQTFLQLSAMWEATQMQSKRAILARKLLANRNDLDLDDSVLIFFETLAHMVSRNAIDRDLVWNMFHIDLCCYWVSVRHFVLHVRKELSNPLLFAKMEELNNRFRNAGIAIAECHCPQDLSDLSILHFLEWESRRDSDGLKPG